MWPGITPLNVWDLSLGDWVTFAYAADDWAAERKKEAAAARKNGRR